MPNKEYRQALKSHEQLAKFTSVRLEFYGKDFQTRERNVFLGSAHYTNMPLNRLKTILTNTKLEGRKLKGGSGDEGLDLKIDLRTTQLDIRKTHGVIDKVKIIYESGTV
jgi:hypothetical protein